MGRDVKLRKDCKCDKIPKRDRDVRENMNYLDGQRDGNMGAVPFSQ